jgi:hypothetical protein
LRPKTRRRRSGEDTRELFLHARHLATMRATPISTAIAYLADTLDWLQLWHHTTDCGNEAASSYNDTPNQFTPKL